jgi:hypothetical protein
MPSRHRALLAGRCAVRSSVLVEVREDRVRVAQSVLEVAWAFLDVTCDLARIRSGVSVAEVVQRRSHAGRMVKVSRGERSQAERMLDLGQLLKVPSKLGNVCVDVRARHPCDL